MVFVPSSTMNLQLSTTFCSINSFTKKEMVAATQITVLSPPIDTPCHLQTKKTLWILVESISDRIYVQTDVFCFVDEKLFQGFL